jgi:hypothetical protein
MNTKLITFTSSVLAVSALVLAYGAGCGDDDDTMANAPTNAPQANVATNAGTTNVGTTNVGTTNVGTTNTGTTNTGTTNATALAANYIDDGTIKGYCFGFQQVAGADTECDLEANGLTCPYSLPGTSWDDIAMLGCNINQSQDGEEPPPPLTPTFTQVCIMGTGFERIQIQGPNGETDANDRWCAPVPAGGGCVELTTFNTTCWDNAGAYYAGSQLTSVAALQPSKSDGVDVATTPISDTIVVTDIHVQ